MMALPSSDAHLCSSGLKLLPVEQPEMLAFQDNLQNEKQISIDPISMKEPRPPQPEPETVGLSSPQPPVVKPPSVGNCVPRHMNPLQPSKYKFLSNSLPNSASSSPRSGLVMLKSRGGKHQSPGQTAPSPSVGALAHQHSVALTRLAQLRERHYLQRSKSCGEGRTSAPADDFDMWLTTIDTQSRKRTSGEEVEGTMYGVESNNREGRKSYEGEFKCGALCLFLPGFGKGKPVRASGRKEELEIGHVISRTVSLEKFECGSWTSSAIMNGREEDAAGHSSHRFFDLPLELIRGNVNDANSPVSSAFVFDKDRKGVLKNSGSRGTVCEKSKESSSSRHVRFSTSSPQSYPNSPSSSCITPRLRKAREDFNAFLEAQSA